MRILSPIPSSAHASKEEFYISAAMNAAAENHRILAKGDGRC